MPFGNTPHLHRLARGIILGKLEHGEARRIDLAQRDMILKTQRETGYTDLQDEDK